LTIERSIPLHFFKELRALKADWIKVLGLFSKPLLKLKYWQSQVEYNRGHWEAEIANFRKQIKDELERLFLKKI